MNKLLALTLSIAAASAAFQQPVLADSKPSVATTPDKLAQARTQVEARQWAAALAELRRINDTSSADWNNLMGYSHRKARTPDLVAAAGYYEAALRIDANHRGALEYAGELALMQGDLNMAEQRAAALSKACGGRCEELDDLKGAIARFKANGNRHLEQ